MIGVYKITNNLNKKVYIGESCNIERRWKEHRDSLNNNCHNSYKLQNDWNIVKEENFTFEVLEEIERLESNYKTNMQLIYIEGKYIKEYDSINNGYNLEDTIIEILSGRKVIMKKDLDSKYLIKLIKNNGDSNFKKSKKKKKAKEKGIPVSDIVRELTNDGYIIYFMSIYLILVSKEIFRKENNSFYVNDQFIKKGYFINGRKNKNQYGYNYYKIFITEKGKNFIIDLLHLQKEENITA